MAKPRALPILSIALILILSGCSSTPEPVPVAPGNTVGTDPRFGENLAKVPEPEILDPNRVVARVNDEIITVRSVLAFMGHGIENLGEQNEETIRRILDTGALQLVIERLEVEAARKLGIKVTKEDLDRLKKNLDRKLPERGITIEKDLEERGVPLWQWEEEQRLALLRQRFLYMATGRIAPAGRDSRAVTDIYVRPAEVRGYYDRHPEQFREEATARVTGIFIRAADYEKKGESGYRAMERAKSVAEDIVARARRGESFAALSRRYQKGRELFPKPFTRGTQRAFVEEFAWNEKVGAVSDPNRTRSGYIVLKLLRRRPARIRPFSEMRAQIRTYLQARKFDVARMKIELDLLNGAVVSPRSYREQLRAHFEKALQAAMRELS